MCIEYSFSPPSLMGNSLIVSLMSLTLTYKASETHTAFTVARSNGAGVNLKRQL